MPTWGLSIVRTMVVSDLRGCFEIKPGKGGHGTEASIRFTHPVPCIRRYLPNNVER